MRPALVAALLPAAVAALACDPPGGTRAQLSELLDRDRMAHLGADAALLVQSLSDTVLSLDGGAIRPTSREDLEAAFTSYFEGATYHAWDDLEPPTIRISDDGSMAWVARRVMADREGPAFGGGSRRERFESSWTATYEYAGGAWRMTSVASTFAEVPSAAHVLRGARRAIGLEGAPVPTFVRYHAEATSPDGAYRVTYASAADRSARIEFSLGMSAGISREAGWVVFEPGSPSASLSDTLETFLRGHDLLMNVIDPETRYGPMKIAGIEPFDGRPALRIDGRDALGAPIQVYYAAADTVPLGFRVIDHLRGGEPVRTSLSGWVDRDGGRWPTAARFTQGEEVFDYRIVTIETSETVDPAAFRAPGR